MKSPLLVNVEILCPRTTMKSPSSVVAGAGSVLSVEGGNETLVGRGDGGSVGRVDGASLGSSDGESLGNSDGAVLGTIDGASLGKSDGTSLGIPLGIVDGASLGIDEGSIVGDIVGSSEGTSEGMSLGLGVGGLQVNEQPKSPFSSATENLHSAGAPPFATNGVNCESRRSLRDTPSKTSRMSHLISFSQEPPATLTL